MIRAVEKIRDRLLRAARALDSARVPYAVAGGNAVAAWVSRVDEAAVRNSPFPALRQRAPCVKHGASLEMLLPTNQAMLLVTGQGRHECIP